MIKCPNCGKPAGSNAIDTDVYVWHGFISVYITYECGCGRKFIARSQIPKETHEKMYKEEV